MIDTYRKLFDILDEHERRHGLLVLVCIIFQGIAESIGVASVLPFMAVVANPEVIHTNNFLNYFYRHLNFQSNYQFLTMAGVFVFAAILGSTACSAVTQWAINRYAQMCNYRISTRLLNAYFERPYIWFLMQHSADLGRSVLSEVHAMVDQSLLPALRILSRVAVVGLLIGLIVSADPTIAFFTIAVLGGVYTIIHLSVRHYLLHLSRETWKANEERFKISQEGLAGIKDVKVSGLEQSYLRRYRAPAQRLAHYYATQQTMAVVPKFLLEAIAFGGMILIVVVMLNTYEQGLSRALPVIALYAFAGYRLLPALQEVYHGLSNVKFGAHMLNELHPRLTEAKKQTTYQQETSQDKQRLPLRSSLELNGITFSYPHSDKKALDDISLSIRANTSVAFVGTTGTGKTTVVDVILGLLNPAEGRLIVDGISVTDENRRQWQRSVGYVPQNIYLVDDTVAANIAFGEHPENIDMEAVRAAAKIAEIHDFIMEQTTHQYETVVGERGIRLSGGQRQRIGIARALYRDPSVLVLDEATSALDNVTERAVVSAIKNLSDKKTIIMIAHRLTTVKDCDTIFLLEAGRVVASGSYQDLSSTNASFQKMLSSTVDAVTS